MDKQHTHRVGGLKAVGQSAKQIYQGFVDTKDDAGISLADVEKVYGPAVKKKAKKVKKK